MRFFGRTCFALLASLVFLQVPATGPAFADDVSAVCRQHSAFQDHPNKAFVSKTRRGFNLPNWDRKNPNGRPDWRTLIALKHEGFSHIRLPFFHKAFVQGDLNARAVQSYLDWMVRDVERFNLIGYAVSLDLHPSSDFNNLLKDKPLLGVNRLREVWSAVAKKIAHLPVDHVGVELLNEPDSDDKIWQTALPNLVQALRYELPNHSLIISPSRPQRHEALFRMTPVEDKNVLYAVHYYDPFFFTHQGAEWLSETEPVRAFKGLSFPLHSNEPSVVENRNRLARNNQREALTFLERQVQEPWGERTIKDAFKAMGDWSRETGRMLLVNEFGVLSHHAPHHARLRWLGEIVRASTENCIGWVHWEYSDGFGFVDPSTNKPDTSIMKTLLEKEK